MGCVGVWCVFGEGVLLGVVVCVVIISSAIFGLSPSNLRNAQFRAQKPEIHPKLELVEQVNFTKKLISDV